MVKIGSLVFQWIRLPKQPTRLGSISSRTIKSLVKSKDYKFSDEYFDLISVSSMQKIVRLNRFSEMTYKKRVRDCDDYSFALMGLVRKLLPGVCFGIVWVDVLGSNDEVLYKHAMNFFIDNNKKFYYVEPQTNNIFGMTKKVKPYFVLV